MFGHDRRYRLDLGQQLFPEQFFLLHLAYLAATLAKLRDINQGSCGCSAVVKDGASPKKTVARARRWALELISGPQHTSL
jgi:hypothetical protein